MKRKSIECRTADLFPRIHLSTTLKELDYYKKKIVSLIDMYSRQFSVFNLIKELDVLEVGCGGRASGIYTLESLSPRSIVAIDLSERNVENTKRKCTELGYNNVVIRQGNALKLDFSR